MNSSLLTTSPKKAATGSEFRPIIINNDTENVSMKISLLLKAKPCIQLLDSLQCQLQELVKSRNPGKVLSEAEMERSIVDVLNGETPFNYGNWFYYPWAEKLVHLLPESQFVELRTNRNRNKITFEEQAQLSKARVGVIGLSVGRSVALTLAQERVCGEIRLADFDHLELSNLNRLRASVFEIEQNKAIITARAIAEMDPYLKVSCFDKGIDERNIDEFFLKDGKLDILIEECDGLDIKIKARQKAKALGIPVVMDTNDRGMLDIERFDLEPDRKLLHGKIEGLDLSKLSANMTTEEKVPFVASILGVHQMSTRMKASMMEVDYSIKSWPQLASSVSLGAALCTNVCRRILLDQHRESGRWLIDIDELTSTPKLRKEQQHTLPDLTKLTALNASSMQSAAQSELNNLQLHQDGCLTKESAITLVNAALLAPSGGNSQPWNFLFENGRLFLFLDPVRAFSTIDPGKRYALFALGACLENMQIAANQLSHGISLATCPENSSGLVAIIDASLKQPSKEPNLYDFLAARCTNRKKGNATPLSKSIVNRFSRLDTRESSKLTLIQERSSIEKIAQLCGRAERIRILNPTCHWDMFEREMRWNENEALKTQDGVDVRTLELSFSDETGLNVARDAKAIELIKAWNGGAALQELTEKVAKSSSALCVLSVPDLSKVATLNAGSLLQRLWLNCSKEGIAVQPISAPAFMGLHHFFDAENTLSDNEHKEAKAIYNELRNATNVAKNLMPFFIVRLSYADNVTVRSVRRSLNQHLSISDSHPTHTNERPQNTPDSILQNNR